MRRQIVIPAMVIALVMVLSTVVAGQPRSFDGTFFEQDPLYPKSTPLLQVKSVKYRGTVVKFGQNIDEPDWLTEAEFDVQNTSPFTINGAVLAARILGTSQTLTLVRWNCSENSCDELTSQERPIPPGAVVTFKSQVKAKTLQDLREQFKRDNRWREEHKRPSKSLDRLAFEWRTFRTVEGSKWSAGRIVSP